MTIIAFVFLYDRNSYGQGGPVQKGTAFKDLWQRLQLENHLRELDKLLPARHPPGASVFYEMIVLPVARQQV